MCLLVSGTILRDTFVMCLLVSETILHNTFAMCLLVSGTILRDIFAMCLLQRPIDSKRSVSRNDADIGSFS
jgi:predicted amino acid-binding ACT domain protein